MAKSPKTSPDTAEAEDMAVTFTDAVQHDGVPYADGDKATLPATIARALIAAGVAKAGKQAAPAAPAPTE